MEVCARGRETVVRMGPGRDAGPMEMRRWGRGQRTLGVGWGGVGGEGVQDVAGVAESSRGAGLGPGPVSGASACGPAWRAEAVAPGAALTCRPGSCTRRGG